MVLNTPQYWWYPHGTYDIPHGIHDIPHGIHDIPHGIHDIPHGTEHPTKYCNSTVLHTHYIRWWYPTQLAINLRLDKSKHQIHAYSKSD